MRPVCEKCNEKGELSIACQPCYRYLSDIEINVARHGASKWIGEHDIAGGEGVMSESISNTTSSGRA